MSRNYFCVLCGVLMAFSFISCNSKGKEKKVYGGTVIENPETITFPSLDGVAVTADLYMAYEKSAPIIILCHRASWSRGEYIEIAPRLNKLGFNAIAIDQRSGGFVNGIKNETLKAAMSEFKDTTYVDAVQDIQAALNYVAKNYSDGKVILWGSSYSSSLVLKVAKDNRRKVTGVLSFSPGEYFENFGKSSTWITESASKLKIPVFITCERVEKNGVQEIYDAIKSKEKVFYYPEYDSRHGSQALFKTTLNNEKTWEQVELFLFKLK